MNTTATETNKPSKPTHLQGDTEKVDQHEVCEHNLRKLLLSNSSIHTDHRCQK